MSRVELAALVTEHLYPDQKDRRSSAFNHNYLGKLENGRISWPKTQYRAALRAVLGVATDEELGFTDPGADTTTVDPVRRRDLLGSVGTVIGAGVVGTPPMSLGPVAKSRRAWLATRKFLGANRGPLTNAVYKIYPESMRLGSTGILIPPEWRLTRPIDLSTVRLQWQDQAPSPSTNGGERETRHVRPLLAAGRDYSRYHRAMRDLARPRLFENRLCYRLLNVTSDGDGQAARLDLDLTLGEMCYFDMIDVGEALAHEAAVAACCEDGQVNVEAVAWENLPLRRLIRDPFKLAAYPLMISVSTLTVRASKAGSTFFLLRRNPAKVAIAGGMLSVFPTGVFQPASVLPAPESPDFDLWRNVMREYSEEFLGNSEHDGGGPPIDYSREEPFRSMEAARQGGRVRIYCLGVGVDALNYAGDVLTVAVFDAETFDSLFGEMIEQNDEGEVENKEFDFEPEAIHRLLGRETVAPSGAACLHLAAQHHASLV